MADFKCRYREYRYRLYVDKMDRNELHIVPLDNMCSMEFSNQYLMLFENIFEVYMDENKTYSNNFEEICKVMDSMIIKNKLKYKYLLIESTEYDNPIYLGFGDKEHYIEFRDRKREELKEINQGQNIKRKVIPIEEGKRRSG